MGGGCGSWGMKEAAMAVVDQCGDERRRERK
jgi:hypothetical protein